MEGARGPEAGIPVIAVMPLVSAGASDRTELLVASLHEDISSALSRFRSLAVISPASVEAVTVCGDKEVGQRLGASHVFRARITRGGTRFRLSASLAACAEARQLWADEIEFAADDLFALRDEVVSRVASTLNARLEGIARNEARQGRRIDASLYGLVLQGLHVMRKGTREADDEARGLFEQVLARDPANARAHAGIALSWFNEWSCQFWDRFEEASRLAYVHAHRALDFDDSDAVVHLVIAKVQLFRREFESASWYLDRALALCPNDADLLVQAALCEIYLGRPEAAIENVARAIRLNPYHPNDYFGIGALAHFFARDLDGALALRAKSAAAPFVDGAAFAASALAHAGRTEEARRELAQFYADFGVKIAFGGPVAPGAPLQWLVSVNPFRRPEDGSYLLQGLQILGEAPIADAPASAPPGAPRLAHDGHGWIADFAGRRVALPDLKGLHDVQRLLGRPREEIHCLDLADRTETAYGADAALDDRARAAIKVRIRDLGEELAEAEDMNDLGRIDRARSEMDRLVEVLSSALGLGGRSRRLGDHAERARTTVTWRIRYALRKVEAVHPALGRHLASSIQTGAFCVYSPEHAVAWTFARP